MSLRLVSYLPQRFLNTAAPRLGALLGDAVVDIPELCDMAVEECNCTGSVVALLACPDCRQAAREALKAAGDEAPRTPLSEVRLLAPVPRPGKLFCLAGNYAAHIRESKCKDLGGKVDQQDLATPRIFMKPSTNTVCGPEAPILVGPQAHFVDYEGELAVIIGKRGKHIAESDALSYVGGITCLNDISEREFKIWDRGEDRAWDKFFDWLNGKWSDNSAPMGPCAVPLEDIPDVQNLQLITRVNGQTVQETNTADMIFSVARTIEYLSAFLTLEPGDVIATGTPSGVGHSTGANLKPGDVVEVEIEGVGVLSNPVAAE